MSTLMTGFTSPRSSETGSSERKDPTLSQTEIADRERRRISQEFHDGLGQRLTTLTVAIDILAEKLRARDAPEADDAATLKEMVRAATLEARLLARGISPMNLSEHGFEGALDDLMLHVRDTTRVSTSIQLDEWEPLKDEERARHAFRIIQEAVNNALKHSGALHILVGLSQKEGRREMYIADDGQGLPAKAGVVTGLGLGLMRERAERLSGSLEIRRRPLGGTIICVTFPL